MELTETLRQGNGGFGGEWEYVLDCEFISRTCSVCPPNSSTEGEIHRTVRWGPTNGTGYRYNVDRKSLSYKSLIEERRWEKREQVCQQQLYAYMEGYTCSFMHDSDIETDSRSDVRA